MIEDESSEEGTKDTDDESAAAEGSGGQDQEPKQAQEDSSSVWDSQEHSDAPGPFGTGDQWDSESKDDEEQEQE